MDPFSSLVFILAVMMSVNIAVGQSLWSSSSSSSSSSDISVPDKCIDESCFRGEETTACRCDEMCRFFGDCCPDYVVFDDWSSNKTLSNETLLNYNLSNETPINENLSNKTTLKESLLDPGVWECIDDSFLPSFYPDLRHGYRMVARCPPEWSLDENVRRNCEEIRPNATKRMIYIYQDTYFRNLGCATCHGYEESALTPVSVSSDQLCKWSYDTLECLIPLSILLPNASANISGSDMIEKTLHIIPKPRLCLLNSTENCPNGTNDVIARECLYYHKPFINEGITHKHPSCSLCNGGPTVICPRIPAYIVDPRKDEKQPIATGGVINIFLMPGLSNSMDAGCIDGFELDDSGNCAPALSDWPICQIKHFGLKLINGTVDCLDDMLCYRNVTTYNTTSASVVPPPCLVRSSLHMDKETISFSLNYENHMNPSFDEIFIQRNIIQRLQTPSRDDCKNIEISASKLCYVEDNTGNVPYHCSEETFVGHYSDLMPFLINNESLIFFNGSYIRPRWWSNVTSMQFSDINFSLEYQFMICGSEVTLQTCSFFTVSNDSIEWIDQENQSTVQYQDQIYDKSDILINPDGSINICHIATPTDRTLTIVGHVLFAISSVCLFATLITYIAFSTLRNRQGVCIMNFIVALFLGQILLQYIRLFVSQLVIPCIVVAALSHFFFLASFVWTTILAWDLSRSFAASKVKTFSSSTFGAKMVVFVVIGWGTPLAFVLITLLLQFGGFQNSPLLEYERNTCWLSKLSSIVMFFVPMSVCLLSNLVLFIITVHGVHSTKKTTSMLRAGEDSEFKQWAAELRIYIKISALLGFAWLFGFLAMVIRVLFVEYLFIIVISLQGVFIFISFGANRRVKKLWRTSMDNSTLWTTLSRRDYSAGHNSTGSHHRVPQIS